MISRGFNFANQRPLAKKRSIKSVRNIIYTFTALFKTIAKITKGRKGVWGWKSKNKIA